jgi:hypothetical protein
MDILPRRETAAGRIGEERRPYMAQTPKLSEEMKKMAYEPLLPVEKKLIGWSIGIGVVLLGLLVWTSYTFFPAGH